jgi:hypothetical protein
LHELRSMCTRCLPGVDLDRLLSLSALRPPKVGEGQGLVGRSTQRHPRAARGDGRIMLTPEQRATVRGVIKERLSDGRGLQTGLRTGLPCYRPSSGTPPGPPSGRGLRPRSARGFSTGLQIGLHSPSSVSPKGPGSDVRGEALGALVGPGRARNPASPTEVALCISCAYSGVCRTAMPCNLVRH